MHASTHSAVIVYATLSIEVQRVLAGKAGVLGIKVVEFVEDGAHIRHLTALGVELARHERLGHEEERRKTEQGCD